MSCSHIPPSLRRRDRRGVGHGPAAAAVGTVAGAFDALSQRRCPLFAARPATGVNADTGAVDEHAAAADVTLALAYSKIGLHLLPGSTYAGRVDVLDIGLDAALGAGIDVEMMTAQLGAEPRCRNGRLYPTRVPSGA